MAQSSYHYLMTNNSLKPITIGESLSCISGPRSVSLWCHWGFKINQMQSYFFVQHHSYWLGSVIFISCLNNVEVKFYYIYLLLLEKNDLDNDPFQSGQKPFLSKMSLKSETTSLLSIISLCFQRSAPQAFASRYLGSSRL